MLRKVLLIVFFVSVLPAHSFPFCGRRKVSPEFSGVDASFIKKLIKKINISEPLCLEPENAEQGLFLCLVDGLLVSLFVCVLGL